jgi:hypothetical protein
MRSNDKKGEVSLLIVGIIIVILVFVVLIIFIPREIFERFNILDLIGGGVENREAIRTECILACSDGKSDFYCNDIQNLKLGEGYRIRASCTQLSKMNIISFEGIPSCNNKEVFCDNEKSKEANCYYKSKLISCDELIE